MKTDKSEIVPKYDGNRVEMQYRIPMTRIELCGIAAFLAAGWRLLHHDEQ